MIIQIPRVAFSLWLLMLCNIVFAQSNVSNMLNSGDTKQLKQAARMLFKHEQNSSENLRLLANIIEHEFESAPASRIDALSWGCRALGATGDNQYMPLLQNIYQSDRAHKKLKKYANKAYEQILANPQVITKPENKQSIVGVPTTDESRTVALPQLKPFQQRDTQGLIPKPTLTTVERQLFAIAKGEWQAIKYIAQQVNTAENTETTQLLDALSQFLYNMHSYHLDNEKIDVLAWICRSLGESKNGRYKTLLQDVAEQVNHKKLRNYALAASNSLATTSTPYVLGSVNFHKIINEFKQAV